MKKILHLVPVVLMLFISNIIIGQLPNYISEAEKGLVADFEFTSTRMTPPPSVPVRAAAEWEEVEYLVVTWEPNFQGILRQVVAAGVQECKVIITTQNQNSVANYLTNGGVDLTNVTFLNTNWDSIWIRDYAGNTIYENEVGDRGLADWIYNRPRPNDNVMPEAHAALLGLPIYITNSGTNDLVNTGGNYMSDGLGNAFASELILEENEAGNPYGVSPKTEAQIDQIMEDYMGIQTYIKMTPMPFDVINHIDMHMKLLDEETLVLSSYPEGVADGPQINENIDYILDNYQTPFGTPYKIKRIPAPPSTSGAYPDTNGYYRTYTNALFLNKTILVPTYRAEVDDPALAQWEEMMPGYTIVGIDVDNPGENLISQVGAIHCITHTIGVADPLWIVHQPVAESPENTTVTLEASMKHNSGIASGTVFWREEGASNFIETSMIDAGNDIWTTDIPVTSNNIEYYISGTSISGKTLARPIVAPEGFWTIQVGELSTTDFAESAIVGPYPNPTNGDVTFKVGSLRGQMTITITNLLGQQLYSKTIENGNGTINLDLQDEWNGTLFATFTGDFGKVTKKILKY
ncbi:MAG: agmatine deiminase family protein [Patiriisocius sp.]|uniref:agmatine deiminase family protein n=1 Tax=Patiriisocius sp. TaxID=2822396 RepID=UPI003EFAC8A9